MGCISSKLLAAADLDCPNHFVSLTSTTYGALSLDRGDDGASIPVAPAGTEVLDEKRTVAEEERPSEVIDARELMGDLSDETPSRSPSQRKRPLKPSPPAHRSPAVRAVFSPVMPRRWFAGKENTPLRSEPKRSDLDAHRISKAFRSLDNTPWAGLASAITGSKKSERDSGNSRSRRSLVPLFDPELVAFFEKEHHQEGEQTKKMVHGKVCDSVLLLQSYQEKCPRGGENIVVLYTTTLRGIRKTFEDCNTVRSLFESYGLHIVERDISMDSGYREELRVLMGKKEVKIPVVFIKGRCVGGTEEVLRLEEEAKLGLLLEGLPRATKWCEGCGGLRFVMCMGCNGSCKVLDSEKKKVKCGECNENGLIHCPMCC
ncbi:Glutaredoxin [Musa troglodytarum]|uniref:Glutaredoxin n=1 Tax=Musa troglodytarum TaxID=320322 RepID=A0A9E7GVY9_9LILI|nr:Glutaredoxin [Musa troglodytarum]